MAAVVNDQVDRRRHRMAEGVRRPADGHRVLGRQGELRVGGEDDRVGRAVVAQRPGHAVARGIRDCEGDGARRTGSLNVAEIGEVP